MGERDPLGDTDCGRSRIPVAGVGVEVREGGTEKTAASDLSVLLSRSTSTSSDWTLKLSGRGCTDSIDLLVLGSPDSWKVIDSTDTVLSEETSSNAGEGSRTFLGHNIFPGSPLGTKVAGLFPRYCIRLSFFISSESSIAVRGIVLPFRRSYRM